MVFVVELWMLRELQGVRIRVLCGTEIHRSEMRSSTSAETFWSCCLFFSILLLNSRKCLFFSILLLNSRKCLFFSILLLNSRKVCEFAI